MCWPGTCCCCCVSFLCFLRILFRFFLSSSLSPLSSLSPSSSIVLILNSKILIHLLALLTEADSQRCSVIKVFLKVLQNSQGHTCARVCNFIKEQTLAQVFFCEFCQIFKNTFFIKHLRWLFLYLLWKQSFQKWDDFTQRND